MLTAIIVDDEQKSIKSLELLLTPYAGEIKVIATATHALEAVKMILTQKPNLVFLDIQMPGYDGFDILEQIKESAARIVFITAHKEYAITALRKGAFDYILKPFDEEELKTCIGRLKDTGNKKETDGKQNNAIIELSVKEGIIFVKLQDIVRIEASGSYTVFYLDNKIKHMVSRTMGEYEKLLDTNRFYRCHNSHVVNINKVIKFIHTDGLFAEMSDGSMVDISRKNKDEFLEKIKHLGK